MYRKYSIILLLILLMQTALGVNLKDNFAHNMLDPVDPQDGATKNYHDSDIDIFGSFVIEEATPITVVISAGGTQVIVTSGTNTVVEKETNGMTFQNNQEYKIATAGKYAVAWSMSFSRASGGVAREVEGGIGIGGVFDTDSAAHRVIGAGNDVGNMGLPYIVDLAVDDTISLMIANEGGTENIIVEHGAISILLLDDSSTTFTIDHGSLTGLADFADHEWAVLTDGTRPITGVLTVEGLGTGGQTDYDMKVGDVDGSPTYGMIQMGNSSIGRTSFKAGNIDLDGAILVRNIGGPVTSEIEFIWAESTGDTCRFALPKSAVGNATYNSRSMFLAGPAPADTDFVKVSYWQGQGIFDNLACDTAGTGADLGVQNDLEVEGDIFTDSIKESTNGAGITFNGFDVSNIGEMDVDNINMNFRSIVISGLNGTYDATGNVIVGSAAAEFRSPTIFNDTTADAVNVTIGAIANRVRRSTSSAKYKTNIQTIDPESNILMDLRPVQFTSLCKGDDPDRLYYGFVSDEIHEILPDAAKRISADEFEHYDTRAIAAYLVQYTQRQERQILQLRERIKALER